MKRLLPALTSLALFSLSTTVFAADAVSVAPPTASTWHAQTLLQALANMLLFAGIGIFAAIVGFKIFDKCTPGHLEKEILEQKNVAAAIVAAAVILGVCIIIAASMLG
jgi:uncharacterized membrane protein YjfL (UPF0719 family)